MIARVYQAINAVAGELAQDGVAKTRLNSQDNYLYRSIDDVLVRLAPLLAQHRLCILPRVLERHASERQDDSGALLISVALRAAFDLVCADDGSCHTIEAFGEALDSGDKATAKAMQSAYKYAVLQAFCVPAVQGDDADARTYRLAPKPLAPEPQEGWSQWASLVEARVHACPDEQGLKRLQEDNRASLVSLSRADPDLYQSIGHAIAARNEELRAGEEACGEKALRSSAAPRRRGRGRSANGSGNGA